MTMRNKEAGERRRQQGKSSGGSEASILGGQTTNAATTPMTLSDTLPDPQVVKGTQAEAEAREEVMSQDDESAGDQNIKDETNEQVGPPYGASIFFIVASLDSEISVFGTLRDLSYEIITLAHAASSVVNPRIFLTLNSFCFILRKLMEGRAQSRKLRLLLTREEKVFNLLSNCLKFHFCRTVNLIIKFNAKQIGESGC